MRFIHIKKILSRFIMLIAISILSCGFAFASSKLEDKTTAQCLEDNSCQQAILNRLETRMGGLDYKAGVPTAAMVERLYDERDYQRAVADGFTRHCTRTTIPLRTIAAVELGR